MMIEVVGACDEGKQLYLRFLSVRLCKVQHDANVNFHQFFFANIW